MQYRHAEALLILSGKNLAAQEFNEAVRAYSRWGKLLSGARVRRAFALDAAKHLAEQLASRLI